MRRHLALIAALITLPATALGGDLDLDGAISSALDRNPDLRVAVEQIPQAKASRDKAFAFIQPSASLGLQYRINDREISFDPAADFGDSSDLGDTFGAIYGNLGLIYGNMFENGLLDAQDCADIADVNGFEDCAELTEAMSDGFVADEGDDPPASEPTVIQQKEQFFLSADVTWPLSPRVVSMARAGTHQIDAARASVAQAREQVIQGVVQAYAAAYQAQEAATVLDSQIELAEAHIADTEALLTVGLVAEDAVLRARVQVARLQLTRRSIQSQGSSARRALGMMMGMDAPPVGTLAPLHDAAVSSVDLEQARTDALHRPDIAAAQSQAAAAQEMAVDSILQFLPTFAVSGNWSWSDSASGFDDNQSSWWIGIGASVDLWDGGIKVHSAREAASRRRQAAAQRDSLAARAQTEVLDAHDRWLEAVDALPVAEAERELAAETYRLVQVRYAAGGAKQIEVLDAGGALQQAELDYLQRRVGLDLRSVELMAATGQLRQWASGLQ
ncbi:MAG: TolC family protein [Proteobacteria bacterium]|nr:TolC family protein [Pseudomonadota bacterium]